MRRDKLLEEQLVRLDVLYEYAKMHGEDDQAESIRRRMNKLTENVWNGRFEEGFNPRRRHEKTAKPTQNDTPLANPPRFAASA